VKAFNRVIPFILVWLSFQINLVQAQTAGNNSFDFLSLANSARISALGGNNAAIHDDDITLAVVNPSLITPQMNNKLALSYVNNYSSINFGNVAYAKTFSKLGNFTGSLQFLNYGKMKYADETGVTSGNFKAGEYAMNIGWGRLLDSVFSIGANFKVLYSDLEAYNAMGLAVDVAGSYFPNSNTCASITFRNIGRQLTSYTSSGVQPLPFEIQAGISHRLAHLPFRVSILLQHLEKWDLTYENSNAEVDPFTGQTISKSSIDNFTDKAMRHLVLGGEFIPAKFLSIRVGYNYLRRQEMKIDTRPGTVGFSFGLGLNVSKFSINYTRAAYHILGARNYITLVTNMGDWARK
jgi:hypothetical protein